MKTVVYRTTKIPQKRTGCNQPAPPVPGKPDQDTDREEQDHHHRHPCSRPSGRCSRSGFQPRTCAKSAPSCGSVSVPVMTSNRAPGSPSAADGQRNAPAKRMISPAPTTAMTAPTSISGDGGRRGHACRLLRDRRPRWHQGCRTPPDPAGKRTRLRRRPAARCHSGQEADRSDGRSQRCRSSSPPR